MKIAGNAQLRTSPSAGVLGTASTSLLIDGDTDLPPPRSRLTTRGVAQHSAVRYQLLLFCVLSIAAGPRP